MDYRQSGLKSGTGTRSMGVKLIVVCALALIMTLPSLFVSNLVAERSNRAAEVVKEIGSHVGGPQTFLGPTLAVPYSVPPGSPNLPPNVGVYLIFPAEASANVKTTTTERRRSLFRVPIFQADLKLESTFDLTRVPAAAPTGAEFDWSHAEMVVGMSDARGAMSDATLEGDAGTSTLVPSDLADRVSLDGHENPPLKMVLLGAKLTGTAKPRSSFHVTS